LERFDHDLQEKTMGIRFIADIGGNHNQDVFLAKALIDAAADVGCWGVKLQYFKADLLWTDADRIKESQPMEVPLSWIRPLSDHACRVGLKFGLSVFHPHTVSEVKYFCDFLKISSFESGHSDLIAACSDDDTPLFISYGVASTLVPPRTASLIIPLHCVSRYPAKYNECNMALVRDFKGWSDHTREPAVIYSAAFHGARWIEFHLDLEGEGAEYKYGHCWLPEEIRPVIRGVNLLPEIKGTSSVTIANKQREDLKWLTYNPKTGCRGWTVKRF
jgi:sialic acid synthase SpsE